MKKIVAILSLVFMSSTVFANNTIDLDCKVKYNGQDLSTEKLQVRLNFGETLILATVGGYTVSVGRFNGPHVTVKFKSQQQEIIGMYDWTSAIDTSINTNGDTVSLGCSSLAPIGTR